MEEFKDLEDFEQIATSQQWNLHILRKGKMKLWNTKNKNYRTALKRVEYDRPPKFITKTDLTFKIDESIIDAQEPQLMYNQMRQLTKEFRTQAVTLYVQSVTRKYELLTNEIKRIIKGFPKENDDGFDCEPGYAAFKQYNEMREKRFNLEVEQSIYFLDEQRVEDETIINEAQLKLTEDEYQLLKLGPRFINDPQTAARRRTTELTTLKHKLLQNLYQISIKLHPRLNQSKTRNNASILDDIITFTQSQGNSQCPIIKKKKNYGRLVKRLKYKLRLFNIIIRKTDKSKVFHLGKLEDYQKKSIEYMEKTQVYQCLDTNDPLPDLIKRTNKYLLDLRLAKWISQKQYEQLCIRPNEVELAHLYYLPKAHRIGTPLRPIISGLKHPNIKISKFLDNLLRPLFYKTALQTTVTSGFELLQRLEE
ncbi:unnamed protein product [Didymodactylos carnosus]|uniref:Uncharacterized protein n=1 Tax=Didymodactylos carnosus TaxID=1234261 RepID=A0A814AKW9_9BILA|nr:unnamed protein product [Didymodactylos carnosus]CAF1370808.1 unnamed protein product [Didymodactylos carnosus]CAF3694197.1 unnamed protein product [Didymodactylos carnosus]CAF4180013.1 unnamed protein product [Didymodactylos carnosus]